MWKKHHEYTKHSSHPPHPQNSLDPFLPKIPNKKNMCFFSAVVRCSVLQTKAIKLCSERDFGILLFFFGGFLNTLLVGIFWMEHVPPEGNINRQNGRLEIRFRGHYISRNQQPPLFWLGWLKIVARKNFTKLLSDVLQVPNQVTLSPTVDFDRGKFYPNLWRLLTQTPWQLGPCFFAINKCNQSHRNGIFTSNCLRWMACPNETGRQVDSLPKILQSNGDMCQGRSTPIVSI